MHIDIIEGKDYSLSISSFPYSHLINIRSCWRSDLAQWERPHRISGRWPPLRGRSFKGILRKLRPLRRRKHVRGPPATCGMHASCAVSAGKLILIPWPLPACIRHSIGPLASGLLVEAKRQKEPRLTKRRCGGVRACMLELIKASIHMHASFAADRELESPFPSRERPRGQFSRPHGVARAPQLCRPVFFFFFEKRPVVGEWWYV